MSKQDIGCRREMLRHAVATLAYRGNRVLQNAPREFGVCRACDSSRSALEILSHIADLLECGHALARGRERKPRPAFPTWDLEVERFFDGLAAFDDYLASDQELGVAPESLFQGPVADALTHVGQLATLRRLSGAPVRGEDYYLADITVGRVGQDQSAARRDFD